MAGLLLAGFAAGFWSGTLWQRDPYALSPVKAVNDGIWLTTTRIEDVLAEAVQTKELDYTNLARFLTLYEAESLRLTTMLGESRYPSFSNGYAVNDFLREKGIDGPLNAAEFEAVSRLAELYKALDEQQALLVDASGKLSSHALLRLTELEREIVAAVKAPME